MERGVMQDTLRTKT